jgi:hypothetical protein
MNQQGLVCCLGSDWMGLVFFGEIGDDLAVEISHIVNIQNILLFNFLIKV